MHAIAKSLHDSLKVSTGSGSDRVALDSVVIKVWQLIALSIKHIVNRTCDAALIPQINIATRSLPLPVQTSRPHCRRSYRSLPLVVL